MTSIGLIPGNKMKQKALQMKRRNFVLAVLTVFALSACQAFFVNDDSDGIAFSASAESAPQTKASYSEATNGEKERIDWDDNDRVKIYMHYREDDSAGKLESQTYTITNITDDGIKSKGTLAATEDGPLYWYKSRDGEVHHDFYSVYPADYEGELTMTETGPEIQFTLRNSQDGSTTGMKYAYMAAASREDDYTSSSRGPVELHYYPMVTTLYVTVTNDTKEDINIKGVKLSSVGNDGDPLVGTYTAHLGTRDGERGFVVSDDGKVGDTTVLIPTNSTEDAENGVAFFIRPKTYLTEKLQLSVLLEGGSEKVLGVLSKSGEKQLEPFHKYNIAITIDENGEGELTIDDLTPGGVLMLIQFLVYLNDHYPQLKNYFDAVGVNDYNGFINSVFGELRNKLDGNFTIEQMKLFIKEKDPNNTYKVWEVFQYIADNATELTVGGNGGVKKDITEKDFKVFKKLETITLLQNGDTEFTLSKHPTLKTFRISPDGSNGKLTITITDCNELTTVDFSPLNQNDAHSITIDNCKKLQTVKTNPNNSKQTIKITNCNASVNTQ